MVRKITNGEYLTRYDNMTAGERSAYESRAGEWMRSGAKALMAKAQEFNARMQNVLQVSAGWNDAECQAFEDGARLLSALVSLTDTWLPDMLYVKSAKRAILVMAEALKGVVSGHTDEKGHTDHTDLTDHTDHTDLTDKPAAQKPETYTVEAGGAVSVAPARPKHVDQYVHLLPEKTQEHAAQLKDLYRELDDARQKMGLLMDDQTASPADREAWAKKATSTDNKIRRILDELDAEWQKLVKSGRVVVDDLGNARVVNEVNSEELIVNSDAAAEEEPAELTSEQKARRRELRKWLVDTRRGNGDTREEHVKKWLEAFREFLTFDGDAAYKDEKVMEAAKHYGIDLTQISQISQKDQEAKEAEVEEKIVKS